jgi:NAD(P)H-hydrate epimerase
MKIFPCKQIALIDKYTINHEPITSVNLMERAAGVMYEWLLANENLPSDIVVVAGPGNNGGDGLAIARMLIQSGYNVTTYYLDSKKYSDDFIINFDRLRALSKIQPRCLQAAKILKVSKQSLVIDALFGSGLTRPLDGTAASVVKIINKSGCGVISLDMPSGMSGEDNREFPASGIIQASVTLSLQFPKISFLFAENEKFTGEWHVLPIGLHPDAIEKTETNYRMPETEEIKSWLPHRRRHAHKGDFGHALIMAGSYGKAGAAILASRSCLRSGAGLVTTNIPSNCCNPVQSAVPEAMVIPGTDPDIITQVPDLSPFDAIAAGPGIGTDAKTTKCIEQLLKKTKNNLVLDADALNIISINKKMQKLIPEGTIITPHPGEFDRLAGKSETGYERHLKAIAWAKKHKLVVVLKGAYTQIALPDGTSYFNNTGNNGMATAGSGDVLTGIIVALLAQGLTPEKAAIAGVYLHGLAGDFAQKNTGSDSLISGDLIQFLPLAFGAIRNK